MISAETIAKVREHADIVGVVGEAVKLVRRGRALLGLCPFHKEKTPSFHVNPQRGFFYCFGCHEKGDAIAFLMKAEGLTFTEAVRRLAEKYGIPIEEPAHADRAGERAAQRALQDLYDISSMAAAYFEEQLREHATARVAREELARRGLRAESPTDLVADALQAFRLGYAPAGWDGLTNHLQKMGASPAQAEAVGLLVARKGQSGHYDRFRNRLMFAVIDVQGRVVGFSGRQLPDPETGQVDKESGKYINSPESAIYRKSDIVFGLFQARQAIRQRDEAIVVEGNFDVVSLHARGMRNVVAPLGTAFTQQQAKVLRRYTPRVVVCFDGDHAGREAARKSREPCAEAGLDVRVARLPDGSDPDDFVRSKGVDALGKVVSAARGMLEYLIDQELDRGFVKGDVKERASRVAAVAHILSSEQDPTVRAMAQRYADHVAGRLNLSDATTFRALYGQVQRALTGGAPPKAGLEPYQARSRERRDEIPLEMLGCALDCPEILDNPQVQAAIGQLEGEIALAFALARNLRDPNVDAAESFLAHLPAPIHEFAARRLASPRIEDAGKALFEFLEDAQKIKRDELSRGMPVVLEELERAAASGDVALEEEKLREAERIAREKRGLKKMTV